VEEPMSNNTNDFAAFAGLWITLILSIVFLVQQLASTGVIG
jgi:hypothetical protein